MTAFSFSRLGALALKETLQIFRDPSSLVIAFAMPVLLLFLFGYGVRLDAHKTPVGFVLEGPESAVWDLYHAFDAGDSFAVFPYRDRQSAERDILSGKIQGLIVPRNSLRQIFRPGESASVQVIVDGVNANSARLIAGYAAGVLQSAAVARATEAGRAPSPAVVLVPRVWFNPGVRSTDFLMSGLIGIVMTLSGTLLTALLVSREHDRGTLEALMASPATILEILLGKMIPTFILGMMGMAVSVAVSVWWFGMPFRGSVLALTAVSALFMTSSLAMGLLISSLAKSQFIAGQISLVAGFLPVFLLSGFIFPLDGMPLVLRGISSFVAGRYLVSSLQTLFLAGTVPSILGRDLLGLALIAAVFIVLSARVTRKHLD